MAKIQLNEQQLKDVVENAARETLQRILSEGAGWDATKQAFNSGINGEFDDENIFSDERLKDYVKNGDYKSQDYNKFKTYQQRYNDFRRVHNKAKDRANTLSKSYDKELAKDYAEKAKTAGEDRSLAAAKAVDYRPGIIGKGQRAAVVTAAKAGRGLRKAKEKATDFLHNKIGFEE